METSTACTQQLETGDTQPAMEAGRAGGEGADPAPSSPGGARMRRMFGTATRLLRAGKVEDALTVVEYLTMLDPFRPEYWVAGGMARMRLGHLDEAAASFQVAEAGDAADPVPVLLRAICRLRQGREAEGLAALRSAHSIALAGGDRGRVLALVERHLALAGDRCGRPAA